MYLIYRCCIIAILMKYSISIDQYNYIICDNPGYFSDFIVNLFLLQMISLCPVAKTMALKTRGRPTVLKQAYLAAFREAVQASALLQYFNYGFADPCAYLQIIHRNKTALRARFRNRRGCRGAKSRQ